MAWKVGRQEIITIDLGAKDVYGKSGTFKVIIGNNQETTPDVFTNVMNEIIEPVDSLSATVQADATAGSEYLVVDDVSGWEVGFVGKISGKDIYVYITKVDSANNRLYVRELSGDVAANDTIERVGNTGIYSFFYTPDLVAKYIVIISNPSIGLYNVAKTIECLAHNEDDLYEKIDEVIEKMDDKIVGEIIL